MLQKHLESHIIELEEEVEQLSNNLQMKDKLELISLIILIENNNIISII